MLEQQLINIRIWCRSGVTFSIQGIAFVFWYVWNYDILVGVIYSGKMVGLEIRTNGVLESVDKTVKVIYFWKEHWTLGIKKSVYIYFDLTHSN